MRVRLKLNMRWLSILKKVGIVAGKTVVDVAAASNPIIGGITDLALRNILNAEATLGAGKGEQKLAMVLGAVDASTPLIVRLVEQATGRDIVDDELFAKSMTQTIEGLVGLMNSCNVLPKEQK